MDMRALAGSASAYVVLHHLGLLPHGGGPAPHGTQWADWADLAVPWVVVGLAARAVWSTRPTPRAVALLLAGAIAYTSGHGIHLAANSINNAAPSPTAHLWDEPVGHHLWFLGVALLVAALATYVGWRHRGDLAGVLATAGGTALVWLGAAAVLAG